MSTIRDLIARVDRNNPNAFSKETKVNWIAQLDGKIALNVMLMDVAETAQFRYKLPEALDYEPLVAFPHDDIYELWLNAKIHAENGETERYQNTLTLYNAAYKYYVRWFASTYAPAQDESSAVTYYITAYGLAVQQGYSGSLDEWLVSLIGPKGDRGKSAYEYAVEGGYKGTEEAFKQYVLLHGVESDTTLSVAGGLADAKVTGEKIKAVLKKIVDINESLSTTNGSLSTMTKVTAIKTYTAPAQFGCTAASTPAEIRAALPNGSVFMCLPEELTNEAWNFPSGVYLLQMFKANATSATGNAARVKTLLLGKRLEFGDYQADADEDGVPTGTWYRMPRMLTATVTLSAGGWSNGEQTVNAAGVSAKEEGNAVIPSPAPASFLAYQEANVRISQQGSGTLTFTCDETPTTALTVNILILR